MRFARPPRRRATESVVPMINVVFLLLIFFMMTARIAPPPPFEMTLPIADATQPLSEERTLYLSADGDAALSGLLGDQAWQALAAQGMQGGGDAPLTIRADADLPASQLAAILSRLAGLGITSVDLAIRIP